jgi:Helix-turn-helix domain
VQSNTSQHAGAATHAAVHQFNNNTKPEWLRVPEAVRLFGLCRSSLYELIAAGTIKSTALRKRGALRGIRLINYDSLAAFVEQAANDGGIA